MAQNSENVTTTVAIACDHGGVEMKLVLSDMLTKDGYDVLDLGTNKTESVDYPEGVTQGLRRTTDQLRSVVERTRGDITIALQRNQLEEKIESFMKKIEGKEE